MSVERILFAIWTASMVLCVVGTVALVVLLIVWAL